MMRIESHKEFIASLSATSSLGVLLAAIWLSTYFGRLRWRQARNYLKGSAASIRSVLRERVLD
jgi:hypothetical protein